MERLAEDRSRYAAEMKNIQDMKARVRQSSRASDLAIPGSATIGLSARSGDAGDSPAEANVRVELPSSPILTIFPS